MNQKIKVRVNVLIMGPFGWEEGESWHTVEMNLEDLAKAENRKGLKAACETAVEAAFDNYVYVNALEDNTPEWEEA